MTSIAQEELHNRLLRIMSAGDFLLLQPHLHLLHTQLHQVLIEPLATVEHLYFPEVGFTSVTTAISPRVELGIIGIEGLVGASPVLLGSDRTPFEHFIQAGGELLRIGVVELTAAIETSPTLHRLLLRYVQTLLVQTAHTAFVNATLSIEARLARWLLMCQDRLPAGDLAITHEFLAMMLGVQRTSVTLTLQLLEGEGLIRAKRGRVEIRDREGLIAAANGGYGMVEAEYARIIEGR